MGHSFWVGSLQSLSIEKGRPAVTGQTWGAKGLSPRCIFGGFCFELTVVAPIGNDCVTEMRKAANKACLLPRNEVLEISLMRAAGVSGREGCGPLAK